VDSISCTCPLWHLYCDCSSYPFCRKFRGIQNLSTPLKGRGLHQERWDMTRAEKFMLIGMYIAAMADVVVAVGILILVF